MRPTLVQERLATETHESAPTGCVTRRFKTVQFHAKVITKTFYKKLKSTLEEIDLANEEEYPLWNSDFAIKRREKKTHAETPSSAQTTDSQAHTHRQTHTRDIAERK